jgi:isopentenyldiphosphate isomerase
MSSRHEEWVDVVDEHDRVIDRATRRAMREGNLLHRNVSVLCLDSRDRVYVHRRTPTKDVFPSMYDLFASGVVASGESYDDAARRELGEELGIRGAPLVALFKHRYEGAESRSFTMVYEVRWDGEIVHQPSEVAWGSFMSLAEIAARNVELPFVPDGWEIFRRYLEERAERSTSTN